MTSDRLPPKKRRHDVFISFRGEDTRHNIVSHLHKRLSESQINTFIDEEIRKGDDFPPALLTAIHESSISLVIFSENYADSTWCLKELAEIIERKNTQKHIVVPVFYNVDPSHVRSQTGKFGAAFDRLLKRTKGKMDFSKAGSHLTEAATVNGWAWDSQVIRKEAELVTGIVGDVLNKLNLESFSMSNNLVGISSHIEQIESLLCLDTLDVSIVGIWGMGGIGKSTISRAVFNRICKKFEVSHFLPNVRDELKKQSLNDVREVLLQKIFEKECQMMGTHDLRPEFIRRQLQRKKVLIVLDDVSDAMELKELLGGQDYTFGNGSKILVTSRDKQVLKSVTSKIYNVGEMDDADALKLFSLNAFKQTHPATSFQHLSSRALHYAKGNPLALVVLGSALFDRSKDEWASAFEGLEKEPDMNIQNVLRISYNTLSYQEQKMFLDISCFLCGSHRDFVNEYYDNSGLFKIKILQDRSLISISSSNMIEMHDLLIKMGRSIDQEEHSDNRERLWNPVDICSVLENKTGTTTMKAMSLDMSGIKKMYLDSDVFGGMDSLQYLKFYNNNSRCDEREKNKVYFSKGLQYLPQGLRYFHWDGFPAKSLPPNFCAEHLVELWMNCSLVKELWRDAQNVKNLRVLSLRKCTNLIKIPDLSMAKKLVRIDLSGCNSCRNAPSAFVSEALEYLDLSGCLNVRRFPNISSKILIHLDLSCTDIEEVPSSVESFSGLKKLKMRNCKSLSSVSTNILKLKSLEWIYFSGCSKLESFPETLEPLQNVELISLSGCRNLKSLPQNLHKMGSLNSLRLVGWRNLKSLPDELYSMRSLKSLCLDKSGISKLPTMQLPSSISIERLSLEECDELTMQSLADAIPCLASLQELSLSGNKWDTLPENMDQLSNLTALTVNHCKCLRFIPKLPSSLNRLVAINCESLEWIRMDGVSRLRQLVLANCFSLGEVTQRQILIHSQSMITQSLEKYRFYNCMFPFSGSEILEAEYTMEMKTGNCATIQFPSSENWDDFLGIYLCMVCTPPRNESATGFRCVIKENNQVVDTLWHELHLPLKQSDSSEHLFICKERKAEVLKGREVSFEFIAQTGTLDVIKCGVKLVFKKTPPVLPKTPPELPKTPPVLPIPPTSLINSSTEEKKKKKRKKKKKQDQPPPQAPFSINSLLHCFCRILILCCWFFFLSLSGYSLHRVLYE